MKNKFIICRKRKVMSFSHLLLLFFGTYAPVLLN